MERQTGSTGAPETGVLLSQEIRTKGIIQEHADERCFSPASYDLRIGDEYVGTDGRQKFARTPLHGEHVAVPAYGSLLVSTREVLCLPGNVVGRFDLRIRLALKGLFVQMGTQVEPYYHGRLFAILHNVSGREVELKWDADDPERIFTIEFLYTSGEANPPAEKKSFMSLTNFIGDKEFAESQLGGLLELIKQNKQEVERSVERLQGAKDELNRNLADEVDRRFETVQARQNAKKAVDDALQELKKDERVFKKQLILGGFGIAAFSIFIPILIGFAINFVKPSEISEFDQDVRSRLMELQAETQFLRNASNDNNRLDDIATRLDALNNKLTVLQSQIDEFAAEGGSNGVDPGDNPTQEQ